ncbi:hypothetical protein [Aestuariivirga sp.]|uniref:hypothetical protein n=1 Tax=Aestuariivirga sp. TaxID=2650926 RepID=UPI003BAD7A66
MTANALMRSQIGRALQFINPPFYLFDLEVARSACLEFLENWRDAFPRTDAAYSYKTNSLQEITRVLKASGCGAEVVSAEELRWALADGHPATSIYVNGSGKSRDLLDLATQVGATINVDNRSELDTLREFSDRNPKLLLRISHTVTSTQTSRFGFPQEDIGDVCRYARGQNLSVGGFHFHVGGIGCSPARHVEMFLVALSSWQQFARRERNLKISIGGGFPTSCNGQEVDELFIKGFLQLVRHLDIDPLDLHLIAEPGRRIVECAGSLVVRVIAEKLSNGRKLLLTNGGTHLLRYRSARSVEFLGETGGESTYDVYGRLCYESDLLADGVVGPGCVPEGTPLIFYGAGAYDFSMSWTWNDHLPKVLVTDSQEEATPEFLISNKRLDGRQC